MIHPLGMGAEAIHIAKRLRVKLQIKTLVALNSAYHSESAYFNFATLMERTGMTRSQVRRSCRALKRKGLADYQSGLWYDDGAPAGAGYAITALGKIVAEILDEE